MHSKHARATTKKAILGVLLCFALFANTTPIAPAQDQQLTTPEDELLRLQTEYEIQLMQVYNQTGNQQDVIAEATRMAEDMAIEATFFDPVEFDPFFFDPWGGDFPELDDNSDTWRRQQECRSSKLEECRRTYNAELFASAALTTAIFAGCLALTGGSAFVLCVAAALAHHALNIAAAKQRYKACTTRALWECKNM